MTVAAAAMGALTCGTAFLTTVPGFAIAAVAIGFVLAPSIVTGYLASEHLVPCTPRPRRPSGPTQRSTFGAAIANAGAGALITGLDTTAALLLAGIVVIAASVFTPMARLRVSSAPEVC